jgi:hypothetical protein
MTNAYKILIGDRNYTEWNLYDASHLNEINNININPSSNKLFSGDTFECDVDVDVDVDNDSNKKTQSIKILHSCVRSMPSIPGILVLKGGKTFGKYKDKYLYKCIPDDKRFPIFTIPYAL